MDQCSRHATPQAVNLLTDLAGHVLTLELEARGTSVLTARRLGSQHAFQQQALLPLGGRQRMDCRSRPARCDNLAVELMRRHAAVVRSVAVGVHRSAERRYPISIAIGSGEDC